MTSFMSQTGPAHVDIFKPEHCGLQTKTTLGLISAKPGFLAEKH